MLTFFFEKVRYMFRTYEHVLEENIKMWGIIHVHEFLINMWEYNLWECNLWERVPSRVQTLSLCFCIFVLLYFCTFSTFILSHLVGQCI